MNVNYVCKILLPFTCFILQISKDKIKKENQSSLFLVAKHYVIHRYQLTTDYIEF